MKPPAKEKLLCSAYNPLKALNFSKQGSLLAHTLSKGSFFTTKD